MRYVLLDLRESLAGLVGSWKQNGRGVCRELTNYDRMPWRIRLYMNAVSTKP